MSTPDPTSSTERIPPIGPPALRSIDGRGRMGSRTRRPLLVITVALAMVASGGAVFAWQHSQVNSRQSALERAIQDRDAAQVARATAVQQLTTLKANVDVLSTRVASLQKRVATLKEQLAAANAPVPAVAACDPRVMLPVIQDQVEIAPPLSFGSVTIAACENGYARVFANVADPPPGTEDAEQVFLQDDGGTWTVIASGTGIGCTDPDLAAACKALDL